MLSVPLNVESLNSAEKAPVSEINFPCVDASCDVCAGVFVRLKSVQSENENENVDTLLVRERNTGCARSQWMFAHVREESEIEDGVDEERDV